MKKAVVLLLCTVLLLGISAGYVGSAEEELDINVKGDIRAKNAPIADVVTGEEIRIGVSMPIRGEAVWEAYLQGILDGGEELGNVNLIVQSAQNNPNDQLQQIENFIAQGVQGIICSYVDSEAILEAIKKCNDAGVPFIEFSRMLDADVGVDIAYKVSAEVIGMLRQQNDWMVAYSDKVGKKVKIIELMGALTDSYAVDQLEMLAETVANNPDKLEVIQQVPGDWNAEKGLSGLQNALQAHPDVDLIYLHSEFYNAAMKSALTQAGKFVKAGEEGHVVVITSGGATDSIEMLADGYVDVVGCFAAYDTGVSATHAMVALIQGKTLEGTIYEPPAFLVDAANFDELASQAYGMKLGK
ncbi:MAG: sugar ABC transporter substrate-binding protein [Clostridia bacterium]|nr:sugar ABC transporter substrate-binding protein [Clostridia bacterium]